MYIILRYLVNNVFKEKIEPGISDGLKLGIWLGYIHVSSNNILVSKKKLCSNIKIIYL
ncbi:unnamed protein product [Brassica napus]|uniref:(rape) hypothetical protein n=1 Tax=Brassica napus TaxID=3708 RepID=A0A816X1C8_BRANA|nr:unnamed protein product [Brassica napus]